MQISDKVLRVLKGENISPEELQYMVQHAAISSIGDCNRRYFQWLFKVSGDKLLNMRRVEMVEVGRGDSKVYEDHEDCLGEGCHHCGWVGSICRWVSDSVGIHLTN